MSTLEIERRYQVVVFLIGGSGFRLSGGADAIAPMRLPVAMGMAPELTGGSAGIFLAFGIGGVCVWELLACAALRLQVTRGKWPIRLFPRRCGLSYGEGL